MKIYLATPYSHKDLSVRIDRFNKINVIAAKLIKKGYVVFSPISHSHPIEQTGRLGETDWAFWKAQDEPLVDWCDQIWIVTMDGWIDSVGVQCELEMAFDKGIPVRFLNPGDIDKVEQCPTN